MTGSDKRRPDHCTDILLNNPSEFVGWAHNEDDSPSWFQTAYILNATYTDGPNGISKSQLLFQAPAQMCGCSPSVNSLGLAQDMNLVFPTNISIVNARALCFMCRSIIESPNIDTAIQVLTAQTPHLTIGGSWNIGQFCFALFVCVFFFVNLCKKKIKVLATKKKQHNFFLLRICAKH